LTDLNLFQIHGYKKEAQLLKRRVKDLEEACSIMKEQNAELRNGQSARFIRITLARDIGLRREHLITLHNVLEHLRTFGELVPHDDFQALGFRDCRTLHRSCNRFVEEGYLQKERSNPSVFKVSSEVLQNGKI